MPDKPKLEEFEAALTNTFEAGLNDTCGECIGFMSVELLQLIAKVVSDDGAASQHEVSDSPIILSAVYTLATRYLDNPGNHINKLLNSNSETLKKASDSEVATYSFVCTLFDQAKLYFESSKGGESLHMEAEALSSDSSRPGVRV